MSKVARELVPGGNLVTQRPTAPAAETDADLRRTTLTNGRTECALRTYGVLKGCRDETAVETRQRRREHTSAESVARRGYCKKKIIKHYLKTQIFRGRQT